MVDSTPPASLPDDVAAAVARSRDDGILPRSDTPVDYYDEALMAVFPGSQILNLTEFDYGRSYRYRVVHSTNPDAASLDEATFARAVQREKRVEVTHVSLSLVAPFCLVSFRAYEWTPAGVDEIESDTPQSVVQMSAMASLLNWIRPYKIKLLSPSIARQVVPDVSTELCDEGEATVADCLFFG